MTLEPVWLDRADVVKIHAREIDRYGGSPGVLDDGAIDACLARPITLFAYGVTDIFQLAACYAYGFARRHCFVDGNKRTAFASASFFLFDNGVLLRPVPAVGAELFVRLAAGDLPETDLASALYANSVRLPD